GLCGGRHRRRRTTTAASARRARRAGGARRARRARASARGPARTGAVTTLASLARRIYDVAHLTGQFTLRSGATSTEYFDKYRFESDPSLLRDIATAMAPLLPPDVDALAGLELGGVPLATALSFETGLPALFVRKQAKTYGTC